MAIFGKDKTTVAVAKQSYADRLNSIKSMFQVAYNKASNMNKEMLNEIEAKKAQIASINQQIEVINATQSETDKFMKNLEKFI